MIFCDSNINFLSRMPYTQAVLQEVLRIACPVPGTGRAAATDVEVEGLKIKKVSTTLYSIKSEGPIF